MKRKTLLTTVFLATALAAGGCRYDEASTGEAAAPAPTAAAEATEGDSLWGDSNDRGAVPAQRKLIQTAAIHVEVESYEATRRVLDKQLKDLGGYVANARVEHSDGSVSYAELTLRVPADKLVELVSDAAGFGKVLTEQIDSQDVTDSHADLSARLRNAKRLETRLLELLATKTDGVKHLLEVEGELGRVRQEIERYQGQLERLDDQVSLSTVTLKVSTRRVYTAGAEPSLGERMSDTLGSSWAALVTAGRVVLLFAVAILPWLVPLLLAGLAIRALVMRLRRRHQHPHSEMAAEVDDIEVWDQLPTQ